MDLRFRMNILSIALTLVASFDILCDESCHAWPPVIAADQLNGPCSSNVSVLQTRLNYKSKNVNCQAKPQVCEQRQVTLDPPVTAEGYSSVCPLFKDQERVRAVDGMWKTKRTSWILRATTVGLIYTWTCTTY